MLYINDFNILKLYFKRFCHNKYVTLDVEIRTRCLNKVLAFHVPDTRLRECNRQSVPIVPHAHSPGEIQQAGMWFAKARARAVYKLIKTNTSLIFINDVSCILT